MMQHRKLLLLCPSTCQAHSLIEMNPLTSFRQAQNVVGGVLCSLLCPAVNVRKIA